MCERSPRSPAAAASSLATGSICLFLFFAFFEEPSPCPPPPPSPPPALAASTLRCNQVARSSGRTLNDECFNKFDASRTAINVASPWLSCS